MTITIEQEIDAMMAVICAERDRASSAAEVPDNASCVSCSGTMPTAEENSNRATDVLDELRSMECGTIGTAISFPPMKSITKQLSQFRKQPRTKTKCHV